MTLDLDQQLAELAAIADPRARHVAVNAAMAAHLEAIGRLAEVKRAMVRELRAGGASHADVARLLGVSKGQAQKLAMHSTPSTSNAERLSRTDHDALHCAQCDHNAHDPIVHNTSGESAHVDRQLGKPISHADQYPKRPATF